MSQPTRMLVLRTACELGKWPEEVESQMSMDDLLQFAAYLSHMNGDSRNEPASVEDTLIKAFGKPA
jgi:uncharacterized protein YeaC (DUF1315 family)